MARIQLEDSFMGAVMKLAEGNPGALTVLVQIVEKGSKIDPNGMENGLGYILGLDTLGIYGSRIWCLYKDVCAESIAHTLAVLRAWQLGFLKKEVLIHAVDNYGRGLSPDQLNDLLAKVQEMLPNFNQNK